MSHVDASWRWLEASGWLDRRVLLTLAAIMVACSAAGDIDNTARLFGVDLRNRVVGARLLKEGIDPYSYFWRPGEPEPFLDGLTFEAEHRPANRITVTPPMLMIYWPISDLPWRQVRQWWLGLQWVQFAAAGLMLAAAAPRGRRGLVLAVLIAGSLAGDAFRRHIAVGQCYSVYTVVWAAAALCTRLSPARWAELGVGLFLGIATVLRPSLALAVAPAAVSLRGWVLCGAPLGAGACAAVCWPWAGAEIWSSFFRLQKEISTHRVLGDVPAHWRYLAEPPQEIEGVPTHYRARHFQPGGASLMLSIVERLPRGARLPVLTAALATMVAGVCWRWRQVGRGASLRQLLLVGTTLALAADFLLPVTRNFYNNVLWIVPLALLVSEPAAAKLLRGPCGAALVLLVVLTGGVLPVGGNDVIRIGDALLAALMLYLALRAPGADDLDSRHLAPADRLALTGRAPLR